MSDMQAFHIHSLHMAHRPGHPLWLMRFAAGIGLLQLCSLQAISCSSLDLGSIKNYRVSAASCIGGACIVANSYGHV